MGIAYLPHESRAEVLAFFKLAAARRVPLFIHMRNGGPVEPGVIDALQEVIADAAATGASAHVVHITSMGLRETALCLEMIQGARARGLDITTEAYPYTAGMTDLSSAIFSEGWQARQGGITFSDLQWALTGERLTAETFAKFRKQGGFVAIHSIPEETVRLALGNPLVMVASDGLLDEGKGHPRAAGTYARVLGRYVREQHALTLMDALRKMTAMPADRLGLKSKGRIAVGRRCRHHGLRPGARHRPRDFRQSRAVFGGDTVRAGKRHAGSEGRGTGERRRPRPRCATVKQLASRAGRWQAQSEPLVSQRARPLPSRGSDCVRSRL